MSMKDRTVQELLADYAGAMRDGGIPTFIKSLKRDEVWRMTCSADFRDAAETARILNQAGFSDKIAVPDTSLFVSRVNVRILSRTKRSRGPSWGMLRPQSRTKRFCKSWSPQSVGI